jgi:hypothetical protein
VNAKTLAQKRDNQRTALLGNVVPVLSVGGDASATFEILTSEAVHGTLPSFDASSKHELCSPPTTPKRIRQTTALFEKKKKNSTTQPNKTNTKDYTREYNKTTLILFFFSFFFCVSHLCFTIMLPFKLPH